VTARKVAAARPVEEWPVCPSCRRVTRTNLDGHEVCPYERCDRYRIVDDGVPELVP